MLPTPESIARQIDLDVMETIKHEDEELARRLPLAFGVSIARYIDGMREVVAYDIAWDGYLVRHDWLRIDGTQMTYFREGDDRHLRCSPGQLEMAVAERRAEARRARGDED